MLECIGDIINKDVTQNSKISFYFLFPFSQRTSILCGVCVRVYGVDECVDMGKVDGDSPHLMLVCIDYYRFVVFFFFSQH
jgi:hypothetical protein